MIAKEWPLPRDQPDRSTASRRCAQANDAVRPWNSLNDDRRSCSRGWPRVYAGFSGTPTLKWSQVIDLGTDRAVGQHHRHFRADNGASGKGSPNGSVNENKFANGYPDELSENMKYLDVLGGPDAFNHYPTGWAAAFDAVQDVQALLPVRRGNSTIRW